MGGTEFKLEGGGVKLIRKTRKNNKNTKMVGGGREKFAPR